MTIMQEVQKWSQKLPTWQQDAVAKLYARQELSVQDYDDIYALLKVHCGIPDPSDRSASKLNAEQVSAPQSQERHVQIVAIKNLCNVNALAEDQRLPINPKGLSVIYGENGTGKSGYSRVFKKACRARDQSELIHANAHAQSIASGPAKATFELLVNTDPVEVNWSSDRAAPEELSSISIFDTYCARAYVDNRGDFAYVPYGLDILGRLVSVCAKLKTMADRELTTTRPNTDMFAELAKTPTQVGRILSTLSATTDPGEITELTELTEVDLTRLQTLSKALAEADPKQKAQSLRIKATRLTSLMARIASAIGAVSDDAVSELKILIEKSVSAKVIAELASKKFTDTPGLLPTTGSEAWKALFEAARAFAVESHAGKEFPHLGSESPCPLCQNPLQADGAARLELFEVFIQQEAERAEKAARKLAVAAYRSIEQAQLDLAIDAGLVMELEVLDPRLSAGCAVVQQDLLNRRGSIMKACAAPHDWTSIVKLSLDPREALAAAETKLLAEVKALDDSMDEIAKAAMVGEHRELEARRRLSELKTAALDAIAKFSLSAKLLACSTAAASTTSISRKSTELSKTMATQEVADALNHELKCLNVHELKVVMRPESPKGKTQFKLVLEIPGTAPAKDILSEGEQRAIALASFLAEVNLGKGTGGVVFDDPVSSLDHRRRWHVARRLAEEATRRQVIVLTHDIYFLCILQQEAAAVGLDLSPQCIRKTSAGFGVQTDRLPFDAMSTSKRVKSLRQMHAAAAKAHADGDDDIAKRNTHDAYYHLRLAWERGVEEVLFQGAVTRFGEGISTQKLSYVVVEDGDYVTINAGMTKSSKFAHDPAAAANLPTPHPDELSADIEALEKWRKSVEDRKDGVRARRTL